MVPNENTKRPNIVNTAKDASIFFRCRKSKGKFIRNKNNPSFISVWSAKSADKPVIPPTTIPCGIKNSSSPTAASPAPIITPRKLMKIEEKVPGFRRPFAGESAVIFNFKPTPLFEEGNPVRREPNNYEDGGRFNQRESDVTRKTGNETKEGRQPFRCNIKRKDSDPFFNGISLWIRRFHS